MTAGEHDRRTVGVRVVAVAGPRAGDSGVVVAVDPPLWYVIAWDDGAVQWYHADDVITETQALANVRVLP